MGSKKETITVEELNQQLQSLMHEIDIETIQKKLKSYEAILKPLTDNMEILVEVIERHKKQKNTK